MEAEEDSLGKLALRMLGMFRTTFPIGPLLALPGKCSVSDDAISSVGDIKSSQQNTNICISWAFDGT